MFIAYADIYPTALYFPYRYASLRLIPTTFQSHIASRPLSCLYCSASARNGVLPSPRLIGRPKQLVLLVGLGAWLTVADGCG